MYYRMPRSPFVYIIFQASSGRKMDQNKGLLPLLKSILFEILKNEKSYKGSPLEPFEAASSLNWPRNSINLIG